MSLFSLIIFAFHFVLQFFNSHSLYCISIFFSSPVIVTTQTVPVNSTATPPLEYWEYLFTFKSKIGFVGPGFAYLSGVLLDIILLVMFLCSLSFVRRGGHFQVGTFQRLMLQIFLLTSPDFNSGSFMSHFQAPKGWKLNYSDGWQFCAVPAYKPYAVGKTIAGVYSNKKMIMERHIRKIQQENT